jgi:flagellar biosynthetic protein FliQ
VPKLIGVGLVILLTGNWMLGQAVDFTHDLFNALPQLLAD